MPIMGHILTGRPTCHGYYKSVSTIATLMPSQTGSTVE